MATRSIERAAPRVRSEILQGLTGIPNQITLVRTIAAMLVAIYAFHAGGWKWLVIGYVVYWAGDILDGTVARLLDQETVIGAVFDVICDRANCLLLAGAFIAAYPAVTGPLTLYVLQFTVIDTMLTLAFLLWPGVISPNYFYQVDRHIWLWNWSKVAKALNSTAVIVSLVLGLTNGVMWLAYTTASIAAVVKIVSTARLLSILTGRTAAVPSTP
jgi:CDP-diacylglycerol---glycerol-3-phosphate 3-phosphatidyltransferase